MWKDYFGPKAKIYRVDINPPCKQFEEEQIQLVIGDQEDKRFLQSLADAIPRVDILIDDGGHTMKQQIHTFEVLFPYVSPEGIYLCEDLIKRTPRLPDKVLVNRYQKLLIEALQ